MVMFALFLANVYEKWHQSVVKVESGVVWHLCKIPNPDEKRRDQKPHCVMRSWWVCDCCLRGTCVKDGAVFTLEERDWKSSVYPVCITQFFATIVKWTLNRVYEVALLPISKVSQ